MARILAPLTAALTLAVATPAQADWVASWTAAPVNPLPAFGPLPATPSYANRTIRQTLRLSAGGGALRIRLSNTYGKRPLRIGAARITLLGPDGKEMPGTSRRLSFGGAGTAVIPRGAPMVSDVVALDVPAFARLSLSLYLPDETGPCTCHPTGVDTADISAPGDFTAAPFPAESTMTMRAFVAGVEVDAAPGTRTLAVFGDSISDGVGSTLGANRRWPDLLADRLAAAHKASGVANQGISGNRVLSDGMGESALARFDRDILALPGIRTVILFEGVNDIGIGFGLRRQGPANAMLEAVPHDPIDTAQLIEGYRQIIARAHAHGIRVLGATIAPYKGASTWSEQGEAVRQEVNRFIRSSGAFDGVLDFDKVWSDPADPAAIRADYHMGDHLHGNDKGYRALADSIDLRLIR